MTIRYAFAQTVMILLPVARLLLCAVDELAYLSYPVVISRSIPGHRPTTNGVQRSVSFESQDDHRHLMYITSKGVYIISSSRVAGASHTLEGPSSSSASRLVLLHFTSSGMYASHWPPPYLRSSILSNVSSRDCLCSA
jgi:hypothetical protein